MRISIPALILALGILGPKALGYKLDTICLVDDWSIIYDTTGLGVGSLDVTGNCDTAVFSMRTTGSPRVPVIRLAKVTSCSLGIKYFTGAGDTVVYVCDRATVLNRTRRSAVTVPINMRLERGPDGGYLLSYALAAGTPGVEMVVGDVRGRVLRRYHDLPHSGRIAVGPVEGVPSTAVLFCSLRYGGLVRSRILGPLP